MTSLFLLGSLVTALSFLEKDEESEKWSRLEEAVAFVEQRLLTVSTDMERKALGLDVDFLFEKLDAIEIKRTQSATREKRKALVSRVNKVAETLDRSV